jgi:LysM domain
MKHATRPARVAVRATLLVGGLVVLSCAVGQLALEALRVPGAAVDGAGPSGLATMPLAPALTALAALVVLGCWLWLAASIAIVTVGTTLDVLRRGTRVRGAAPGTVRRLVAVCLGVTVCATAPVAAHATTVDHSSSGTAPAPTAGLTGLALPDRMASPPAAGPERPVVTVRPGQSLWSIAAGLVPVDAGTAEVAAECRRLWRLNEGVVGPDPDLIFPGTRLVVPRHGHLRKDTP